MELKMSKSAALAAAQKATGNPSGSRTSWRFYGPYHMSKPNGPTTEIRADSYKKIVQMRSNRVATLALHMIGVAEKFEIDPIDWIEDRYGPMSAKAFLDEALKLDPAEFAVAYDDSWCA